MMSWLIDRQAGALDRGLVVKKGLNIFSLTSAGMPCSVANPDFDRIAEAFRGRAQRRLETSSPASLRLVAA